MSAHVERRAFLASAAAFGLSAGLCAGEAELRVARRPFVRDPSLSLPLMGFGCANRFPHRKGAHKDTIDYALGERLVAEAMACGVNWFDTGYAYHAGESERFLGKTLAKYPRAGYLLTDKMPTWLVKKAEDAPRIFEEQLARCRTDYFDFYLLHSVGDRKRYEQVYRDLGVLAYLREQKRKGRIRHLGLSFHGRSAFLGDVLDANPDFDVCMLMLNALEYQWNKDARKLAATAAKRNVAVLVMEPLAGGRAAHLVGRPLAKLRAVHPEDSAARWGMRFAASEPGVACIFSGMARLDHLRENVQTLSDAFRPLDTAERTAYDAAVAEFVGNQSIPCTGCAYCVPCPYGVRIPELFAWYNAWAQEGRLPAGSGANDSQDLRRRFLASYRNTFASKERADRCLQCRKCLVSCPQWTFRIPVEMEKIAELVEQTEKTYVAKGGVLG